MSALREQDHPRLCGEKIKFDTFSILYMGSPPPMRGKAALIAYGVIFSRITPAYAGKRADAKNYVAHSGDHPRLCGEKFVPVIGISTPIGSPPPMRGKVDGNLFIDGTYRITPAYAGKS